MNETSRTKLIKDFLLIVMKYSKQTAVEPEYALAIIEMESGGNCLSVRHEPELLASLQKSGRDEKLNMICKTTGLAAKDVCASYGAMQLLVTTAWGYLSARHKNKNVISALQDPDQGVRYGMAHFATLLKKYHGIFRLAARDYNGAGPAAERYGLNAAALAIRYKKLLEKVK